MELQNNINIQQKILITQRFQLFTKILQMNSEDLFEFIDQQVLDNPVIELDSEYEENRSQDKLDKKLEWLEEMDEQNQVYHRAFKENYDEIYYPKASSEDNSLQSYLLQQLDIHNMSSQEYKIAKHMIYSLDENGYLETGLDYFSNAYNIGRTQVDEILKLIQKMDPPGVGSRSLKECLFIQLKHMQVKDKNAYKIVDCYLDMLGRNKIDNISKVLNITIEKTKGLCSVIKSLNPKPGSSFVSSGQVSFIKPDVIIEQYEKRVEVVLNRFSSPRISICSYYRDVLRTIDDKDTKKYIQKNLNQASWLINCIENRYQTLLDISKLIVEEQYLFFNKGYGNLIPLRLRDIAEKLSVHESTVSRAIRGKYLQCKWGTFGFNYFFPSCTKLQTLHDISSEKIKIKIKGIIDNEDKKKPLSDQKITDILKESEIIVARRTVAKYREDMQIPGTTIRREF